MKSLDTLIVFLKEFETGHQMTAKAWSYALVVVARVRANILMKSIIALAILNATWCPFKQNWLSRSSSFLILVVLGGIPPPPPKKKKKKKIIEHRVSKRWISLSDIAIGGVWYGSALFAYSHKKDAMLRVYGIKKILLLVVVILLAKTLLLGLFS